MFGGLVFIQTSFLISSSVVDLGFSPVPPLIPSPSFVFTCTGIRPAARLLTMCIILSGSLDFGRNTASHY